MCAKYTWPINLIQISRNNSSSYIINSSNSKSHISSGSLAGIVLLMLVRVIVGVGELIFNRSLIFNLF